MLSKQSFPQRKGIFGKEIKKMTLFLAFFGPFGHIWSLGNDLKKKWKFVMAFAIKRRPLPLNGSNFHPFFTPLFSFAIESYL